jgi:hypothetical protein
MHGCGRILVEDDARYCPRCGHYIEIELDDCHTATCGTTPLQRSRRLGKVDFGSLRLYIEYGLAEARDSPTRKPFPSRKKHFLDLIRTIKRKVGESEIRERAVKRLLQETDDVFMREPLPVVQRVDWELLPPGEWNLEQFASYFSTASRTRPSLVYQPERIEAAVKLKPVAIYTGKTGRPFHGYIVFCFRKTGAAVLEHPYLGHALYFIRANWQQLSRLSKRELLDEHRPDVERVVHVGDWAKQVRTLVANSGVRHPSPSAARQVPGH